MHSVCKEVCLLFLFNVEGVLCIFSGCKGKGFSFDSVSESAVCRIIVLFCRCYYRCVPGKETGKGWCGNATIKKVLYLNISSDIIHTM